MILSRTTQYAIQTLIYVAMRSNNEPVLARKVAESLDVPSAYLSKIMQVLSKGGLLDSFRGPQGGFRLKEGAESCDLMQIVTLMEGTAWLETCVLGLKRCSDETACPMHARWQPIKKQVIALLHDQTLEKLAAAVMSGRYRIADLPMSMLGESTLVKLQV